MKLGLAALLAFLAILVTFALVEAMSLGGQMVFRMRGATADEIGWMEGLEPLRVWDAGRHARIDARYREWAESELRAGRVDQAVKVMRRARARLRARGERPDVALVDIGLETYTRAADRMQRHGRLSLAADWKAKAMESIRTTLTTTPLRLHRTEATISSATPPAREGRAGWGEYSSGREEVEVMRRGDSAWARRGLGGEIPDVDPAIERSLAARCQEQTRASGELR